MQQSVKDCGGDHRIAECLAPVAERLIGGQQDAAPLVARGDQLEQQMSRTGGHRQVAELIDDQQVRLVEAAYTVLPLICAMRSHQLGCQYRCGDEQYAAIVLYGGSPERDSQMGFTHPRSLRRRKNPAHFLG